MLVKKDTVVSLRYIMKDDNGEIIENTINSKPLEYLHGSGNILPVLESSLEGLSAGAKKSFMVHPGQLPRPLHFEVIVDQVREATAEEINTGQPFKKECGPGCCC